MPKLGLILAGEHYPALDKTTRQIDAQLRHWLAGCGTIVDAIEIFTAFEGELPHDSGCCDAWIVSGVPLAAGPEEEDRAQAIGRFLCAAASGGRPIYAINHAEHIVHAALAAEDAAPPETPPLPRAIQNPFRSFQSCHQLFRFNPQTRRVDALKRPAGICPRRMFGTFRRAA